MWRWSYHWSECIVTKDSVQCWYPIQSQCYQRRNDSLMRCTQFLPVCIEAATKNNHNVCWSHEGAFTKDMEKRLEILGRVNESHLTHNTVHSALALHTLLCLFLRPQRSMYFALTHAHLCQVPPRNGRRIRKKLYFDVVRMSLSKVSKLCGLAALKIEFQELNLQNLVEFGRISLSRRRQVKVSLW